MKNERIIQSAALAGKIILESGGETYRVEDTINRILLAYGVASAQSFVTPTGIVISGDHQDGTSFSRVIRIRAIDVDLERISLVNDLSRRIAAEDLSPEEFEEGLKAIMAKPHYPFGVRLFFAGFAAFSFTLLFRGTPVEAILAILTGMAVFVIRRLARGLKLNSFLQNASGGLTAVLGANLMRLGGLIPDISTVVIGTIMLLVPGITITNAIRDTFQGDYLSGVTRGVDAFVTAAGIAFGTALGFLLAGVRP